MQITYTNNLLIKFTKGTYLHTYIPLFSRITNKSRVSLNIYDRRLK